jgi:hypothetical protein
MRERPCESGLVDRKSEPRVKSQTNNQLLTVKKIGFGEWGRSKAAAAETGREVDWLSAPDGRRVSMAPKAAAVIRPPNRNSRQRPGLTRKVE